MSIRGGVVDPEIRSDGLNSAAILYNQLGQYRLGLHYAEEVLASEAKPRARCFASHLSLEARQGLKLLPSGDREILAAIDLCAKAGEPFATNFTRALLARKWAGQGKGKDAITLLKQHLPEAEATGYPRLIGEIHSLLAELLLRQNDLGSAETHAKAAIAQSAGLANSLPLVMAYKVLHEIAERRRDPSAALRWYKAYAEADKAYLDDVKARELAYQIARQENAQKTQQIELLDRQNQVLVLQQRVDKQAAENSRLLIGLLALAVAFVGYWAYKTKRVQLSLRRLAETDMLTGASNRRHFTQRATQLLQRCEREGRHAALVMFDLDHFKSINDGHGHDTGDWVLTQVAACTTRFCRGIDLFARLGGEEFALLLPECDQPSAARLAEDLRRQLNAIATQPSGHDFTIAASFGVTSTAQSGYDLGRLLSHADRMLYRAKGEGRNRVAAYDPAWLNAHRHGTRGAEPAHRLRPTASADDAGRGDAAG